MYTPANELRSIDYATRRAEKLDKWPPDVLQRITDIAPKRS
jgi:hypothetical protein